MICQQTKQECGCQSLLTCTLSSRDPSRPYVVSPPPTMAEIERLVDAYGQAQYSDGVLGDKYNAKKAAKAALMAAIQRHIQE